MITYRSNLVCPGFPSLALTAVCNRIYCTGFTPTVSGIPPSARKEKSRTGMIVGISVSAGVLSLALIFAVVYITRKKDSEDEEGTIITTCTCYSLYDPSLVNSNIDCSSPQALNSLI